MDTDIDGTVVGDTAMSYTQSKKESLARACGWRKQVSEGEIWWISGSRPNIQTQAECPNLFEPGPEHERMEIEFQINGGWVTDKSYEAFVGSNDVNGVAVHSRPSYARGYAVLAYCEWRDNDDR